MNNKQINKKKLSKKINKRKTNEKIAKLKKNINVGNVISPMKTRSFLVFCFVIFIILIFRLFHLQVIDENYLSTLASKQQTTSEKISSKRGNIYDSTGASLAISETVDTISVNPAKIKGKSTEETQSKKEKLAKKFSEIFELSYDETLQKLNSSASSEVIVQKVEENKVNELKTWMKENKISVGVNIDEDSKRYYPNSTIASQVIGSCGTDNQGLAGIEHSYDSILTGVSGKIVTSTDASQSEIPNSQESFIPAENGYDLTLTLDLNIQSIVEKYLQQAVEENECSKGGNCIVMNPKNGDILAMASYPNYDLNSPRTPVAFYADNWDNLSAKEQYDRLFQMWKVRSVSETYEPGSVFKLITAAVALEEDITKPDIANDFYCNGFEQIYDAKIQCWYAQAPYFSTHQGESLREALMDSCNPSFMQLAKRIGPKSLYRYYNAFGFFDKTKSGLPGEAVGIFTKLDNCGPVELATMSFGQRFTITPLQMCSAICSIANNRILSST